MGTIDFIDPCLNPFDFSSTAQPGFSPATDKFTGNEISFTFNSYNIDPSVCDIQYECTSVTRTDSGDASVIGCSDLTVTTVGDAKKFALTANSADYGTMTKVPGVYQVEVTITAVGSSPL